MKPGDSVKVKSGLMSGAQGTVYKVFEDGNDKRQKVVATLSNGVTLSFDLDELELLPPAGAPPG